MAISRNSDGASSPGASRWLAVVQFAMGAGLVVGLGLLVLALWPRRAPPPGWTVVRPPEDVMALAYYQDALWSGGRDGLCVIHLDTLEVESVRVPGAPRGLVYALLVDPEKQVLWVGHKDGLSRYDGVTWRTWATAEGLGDREVLALASDPDGGLWIGTAHGLSRWHDGQWFNYTQADGLAGEAVSVIYRDSTGRWWFGNGHSTDGGLSFFEGGLWHAYSPSDGLAHPMVNAIVEEPDGPLWFGTGFASRGGLTAFDGTRWWTLTVDDGLAGPKVRSLFVDSQGGLWVGSEYDGVAHRTATGWKVFTPRDGLAGWEVKAMWEDPVGNLWLGTENGLTRVADRVWQQ